MSESYEIVNPLRYPGWDTLLSARDSGDFFHTASWAAVLSETYGYEPVYFVRFSGGIPGVVLPAMDVRSHLTGPRGVALPFTDSCSPILDNGTPFEDLMGGMLAEGRRRGWRYLELRGEWGIPAGVPTSSAFLHHTLRLTSPPEVLLKGFSENTRRNIRRAERDGVLVKLTAGPDSVREFYRLHCLTRRRHGVPPPPFGFFHNLYKHVLAPGQGTVCLASLDGHVIAGAVFLRFSNRVIFKYGASDPAFERHGANHLVMWHAIQHFASDGCSELSFGRTDLGDEGLRRFKRGWGTAEEPLHYHRFDLAGNRFTANTSLRHLPGRRVLSKAPVFLLRAAGAVLYRHVG